MHAPFLDTLGRRPILWDGAMGTMLYDRGIFLNQVFEELCLSRPKLIRQVHLEYLDAGAEVIHMAETGLCADGEQEKLLADGATEIHGTIPVNTDGGLIANGEPIGASGLRQVHELVRQLRGEAGDRQVPGSPRVGLAQVYGAPGTASATILSL